MSAAVEPLALIVTVALLATVQSVFGVGLLVFGTPILLLMGVPFPQVLAYLLPCSIVISVLQVSASGGLTLEPIRRQFLLCAAPAVVSATTVALFLGSPEAIGIAVGLMLLATALLRLVAPNGRLVSRFVTRYRSVLFLGLGVVHGLSNVGGGILTAIMASSMEEKVSIRRHIAFCYGVMAALQFAVVLIKRPEVNVAMWAGLPVIAAVVYLVVGQWLFVKTGRGTYQNALTLLLAAFGTLLVTR